MTGERGGNLICRVDCFVSQNVTEMAKRAAKYLSFYNQINEVLFEV